jgi:hypothetical protein
VEVSTNQIEEEVNLLESMGNGCANSIFESNEKISNKLLKLRVLDLNKQKVHLNERLLARAKSQETLNPVKNCEKTKLPIHNMASIYNDARQ